jgi:secreted PhoX family phosphatase
VEQGINEDRRTFLRRGAMGAGAAWALSLQDLSARAAVQNVVALNGVSPYGPISPKPDETTGLPLLKLPDGFRYKSYSWTGDIMGDGVACPNMHDGMAVVDDWQKGDAVPDEGNEVVVLGALAVDPPRRSGRVVLVRNHEGGAGPLYVGDRPEITYASGLVGNGGTTNLVFDTRRGEWVESWSSLAGTIRNCAGGVTPWGSWLTGEETTVDGHGWVFDVGFRKGNPTPLVEMGRFSHEALMVDPESGVIYETEDAGDCGFYKFVPYRTGHPDQGGRLYMLAVRGKANLDLGKYYPIGTRWRVRWVPVEDPLAITQSCYTQGAALGGARFARLEGCWWGVHTGYFLSTNGGSVGEGQVFEYDPRSESLTVIYDSPNATDVDNPDNIVVTPRGSLLLCEDAAGNHFTEGERLIGLTVHGETYTFGMNNINLATPYNDRVPAGDYRQNEFAGACFSPDGKWLFVNIQTPGVTFAITGPWSRGPI